MNHDREAWRGDTPKDTLRRIARRVRNAFGILDDVLNLDRKERDRAHQRYREIQDCLVAAGIAASTFLQGSFARKTMLKPLKDVDVVILLPASLRYLLDAKNGPAVAMAMLRGPIEAKFAGARFDVTDCPDKALQVAFDDVTFTFDLVVAFDSPIAHEVVLLGNRKTGEWRPSNARTLNRLISTRNVATGGVWVHQGRMFKSFKREHPVLGQHCGLLFESLLYAAVTKAMAADRALAAVFAYAATAVLGPVYDPTGEDDLTAKWSQEIRAATAAAFADAAKRAQEALDLAADGHDAAAVGVWHDILGDPFPVPPAEPVSSMFTNLLGGSITSAGAAVTSQAGREATRPTRPWRSS